MTAVYDGGTNEAIAYHCHRAGLATDIGPGQKLIYASFILATVGHFTLLVLITMLLLFTRVEERSPSVVSLLVATLVSSVPLNLLVYGNPMWNPEPPSGLCVTQASLLAGSATMSAVASWPLVFDSLLKIRILSLEASRAKLYQTFLMAIPYIAFIVFSVTAAVLCLIYPNQIKHHPYDIACFLDNTLLQAPHSASQILGGFALLTALCLEAYVFLAVLRLRRCQAHHRPAPPSLSGPARIIALACLQAAVLITNALSTRMESPYLRIAAMFAQASLPLGTSMITATRWMNRVMGPFKRRLAGNGQQRQRQVEISIHVTIEKKSSVDYDPQKKYSVDGDPRCPVPIHLGLISYEKCS